MPDPLSDLDAEVPLDAQSRGSARGVEFRAVLLLLAMAAILVGTAAYLMWARGVFEPTQPLYLLADDSDGVSVGMDLTFSGFPIGRVRNIELAEGGIVRIEVAVAQADAHWLRTSSIFTLERGLVGAARLRAFTGIPDDPPLPPRAERPVLRGDVSAEVPKMIADAREVLRNLALLTAPDSPLSGTLAEAHLFAGRLNGMRGGLLGALTGDPDDARRVSALLDQADQLLAGLRQALKKAEGELLGKQGLVAGGQESVREINALLADVRARMVQVEAVLGNVEAITGNVQDATTDLGALRADVQANLDKIDTLVDTVSRKWPFATDRKQVTLP